MDTDAVGVLCVDGWHHHHSLLHCLQHAHLCLQLAFMPTSTVDAGDSEGVHNIFVQSLCKRLNLFQRGVLKPVIDEFTALLHGIQESVRIMLN